MKKILLMSGFFYFSLFSMGKQLQLIENGSFGSNITDVSDYSSSASDEDSDSSGYEENQVTNLEIVVGKGFRYGGEIVSLTEVMQWFSADLQAMDKQNETQVTHCSTRRKEFEKKLLCMAKVMVIQQEQIKKLVEENEKRKKENEELVSTIVIQLQKYESERSCRALKALREQYRQSSSSSSAESSTEFLKVKELAEEKAPFSDSPRKINRLSLDVTQLKKRDSPRKNPRKFLLRRISKRNHKTITNK